MEWKMLDQAFEALKTYDWGADPKLLNPIDEAVVATRDDAAARQELEARLVAVLKTEVSRDAKDYVCRKLRVIGTAAAVPALAELLSHQELSHMARFALERIPAAEAAQALRDALPNIDNALKVGVMGSLGARQDVASVPALVALLSDADATVARSAALALGAIRVPEAASALREAKPQSDALRIALTDACLACAEGLLAAGKKAEAMTLYKGFVGEDQPKHVRLAATRGMLACAGKSD
jgi:HEAT repeat protein